MKDNSKGKKFIRGKYRKTWIDYHGYEYCWYNNSCKGVHRLLVEDAIGRPLKTWEHVHHINGDKLDNRITNLEVLSRWNHGKISGKASKGIKRPNQSRVKKSIPCVVCGSMFYTYPSWVDRVCCSKKCFGINKSKLALEMIK